MALLLVEGYAAIGIGSIISIARIIVKTEIKEARLFVFNFI
jgi:hypothetical protein